MNTKNMTATTFARKDNISSLQYHATVVASFDHTTGYLTLNNGEGINMIEEDEAYNEIEEPIEGDYIINAKDYASQLGSNWIFKPNNSFDIPPQEQAILAIHKQMVKEKYWSNIWHITDHGNISLLNIFTKELS